MFEGLWEQFTAEQSVLKRGNLPLKADSFSLSVTVRVLNSYLYLNKEYFFSKIQFNEKSD